MTALVHRRYPHASLVRVLRQDMPRAAVLFRRSRRRLDAPGHLFGSDVRKRRAPRRHPRSIARVIGDESCDVSLPYPMTIVPARLLD